MSRNKLYLGKAGQYIAMSEFLVRGWNVAIPEVDVGDDIFVVKDSSGAFLRVQVKTSSAINNQKSFGAQFKLSYKQLKQKFTPDLIYFFIIRHLDKWSKFVIIKRDELLERVEVDNVGSKTGDSIQLYLSIRKSDNEVKCSAENFTKYVNNFESFPRINHDTSAEHTQ